MTSVEWAALLRATSRAASCCAAGAPQLTHDALGPQRKFEGERAGVGYAGKLQWRRRADVDERQRARRRHAAIAAVGRIERRSGASRLMGEHRRQFSGVGRRHAV